MTQFLRPSDGAVRQGAHINLNVKGFKTGDRVLFEPEFGRPVVDTIDLMDANVACIDGARILVINVYGRLRPGTSEEDERRLVDELKAAVAESAARYHQSERKRIMRKYGVR